MTEPALANRDGECAQNGSALVLALLVTVILSLLGISFLLLAETENQIAQNEKRAAQTLYVAEAGLVAVKHWFDATDQAVSIPDATAVDRTLRVVIDETDPDNPAAATPATGVVPTSPYYKQSIDLDADGLDDLFRKPYRGEDRHRFMGTPDGPDLRIDDQVSAGRTFLDDLALRMLSGFPGESGDVVARISRIDVYAPPYERVGFGWRRYGLATVRVTARLYRDPEGEREILAEQQIEGVLSEIPYRGPHAPLHSCGQAEFSPREISPGNFEPIRVRWGAISSVGGLYTAFDGLRLSLPRSVPFSPGADQLFPTSSTDFATFKTVVADNTIEDPWFRVLAGDDVPAIPGSAVQYDPPSDDVPQDYSNLMQNLGLIKCPRYDYELWKRIATSGDRNVRYFAHVDDGGPGGQARFSEPGSSSILSFEQITNGKQGLYFFDTDDGRPPTDSNADGVFENLTGPIKFTGTWDFTGFIFLNSDRFEVDNVSGVPRTIRAPGEPFLDLDTDGEYDTGEPYINLNYASTDGLSSDVAAFNSQTGAVRDARGPDIPNVPVSFRGIFYNSGEFEAVGRGTFYGSVIALERVSQSPNDGSVDTPTIIWDESIVTEWPPPGWALPRVLITEWDSGG